MKSAQSLDNVERLEAENQRLRKACEAAKSHCDELYQAWISGAIREFDGNGGTRSNRNSDVCTQLYVALTTKGG